MLSSLLVLLSISATIASAQVRLPAASAAGNLAETKQMLAFFGTYTNGESKGIYVASLDMETGKLTSHSFVESVNPSFVAIHPSGKYLYAVNETKDGGVSSFAIDRKNASLKFLNQQPTKGAHPCHLVVDATGKHVLVANYTGGSVISLPIVEDGKLGPDSSFHQHKGSSVNKKRQEAAHAHSINLDKANRFAFVADLGLDKVVVYKFDEATGKLTANDPPSAFVNPGGGPRHFAIHPNQKFAYTNNELTSEVVAFRLKAKKGKLRSQQTISTLPKATPGNSTAEVQVHPSGKFLYCSNRGHNSIAMFTIDHDTGKLTAIGHEPTGGAIPRNFGIDPTGKFVIACNQSTNDVYVFKVDLESGKLTRTEQKFEVPTAVCVKMMPR
ncbi:MAG: 6-phosphogluconolactonase [Planctomycetaceae bacterium]|nr:6-phosphogluconolactonase [Planctomycetaceae bacterium]